MKNASASKEVPKSLPCTLNTISFFKLKVQTYVEKGMSWKFYLVMGVGLSKIMQEKMLS